MILRPGVLDGVRVVAGPGAVADRMASLGADVAAPGKGGGDLDVVVYDGAAVFVGGVDGVRAVLDDAVFVGGVDGVRAVLDDAWDAIRASLADGLLIVLIAPPPGDAHAEAARAGLENMARTLSIEWARRGIRPVALMPGATTSPAEIAELAAFLASPAGAYYSGCRFDLGAAGE